MSGVSGGSAYLPYVLLPIDSNAMARPAKYTVSRGGVPQARHEEHSNEFIRDGEGGAQSLIDRQRKIRKNTLVCSF